MNEKERRMSNNRDEERDGGTVYLSHKNLLTEHGEGVLVN